MKIGQNVWYGIPYYEKREEFKTTYVFAEITEVMEGPYTILELNNGHTAQWNGEKYIVNGLGVELLTMNQ